MKIDEFTKYDFDLRECLENNPQDGFTIDDIDEVLAVVEGERDAADWHWLLLLKDNSLVWLTGGCDYTGWDCQSGASHFRGDPPYINRSRVTDFINTRRPMSIAEAWELVPVAEELIRQVNVGIEETWRQQKGRELFGD